MQQVIFVRHAKSDYGEEFLKDIDRSLSPRGYSDAYYASEWFAKKYSKPDLILSSTATRALSTALIFAREMKFDMKNFVLEKDIYEAPAKKLIEIIKEQDNTKHILMLFGHNPSFTNVCNELSDELFFENIPTCGMVSLKFDIKTWSELKPHTGKLDFYQFPKDFKNKD